MAYVHVLENVSVIEHQGKSRIALVVHPLILPVPRLYRNLGVIPG